MKATLLWLVLLAGALALIAGVSSYEPSNPDPSIVVIGDSSEISDLELPQLEDATFVETLDDLPSPLPSILFVTPSAAGNMPDNALADIAQKGVSIGGINVPIEELARLNGTATGRQQFEDALIEAGEDLPLTPAPPFWSLSWRSCGIIASRGDIGGTMGAGGSLNGPQGHRPFELAFDQLKELGEKCAEFDPTSIPPPSYRIVIIGTPAETDAFAIPALTEALYVETAQNVPPDDVALVLVTPTGARASTRYETEPLAVLYNSGTPIVGLDVDRADLLQYTGLIARLRGVSDEVAEDFYREAKWQGQRPVYSHAWRSCPLELVDEGGNGQSWIGGFGAAPESPPLKTFTMRIEDFREIGANCIDILRRQQLAYIESLEAD